MTRGGAIASANDANAPRATARRALAGAAIPGRAAIAGAAIAAGAAVVVGREIANANDATAWTMAGGIASATRTVAMLTVFGTVACGGSANPVPAGTQLGPALAAAMRAADQTRAPWRCAASDGPMVTAETFKVGHKTWKLEGHVMSRESDGEITIGAIADAGGAAPPTIAALGRLRDKLSKADVIVALGGMGTTKAELEATLGEIADKVPVVAMPGDLEDTGALAAAVAALRAKGEVVIDGRLVQRIELGSAKSGGNDSRGSDGGGSTVGGATIGLVSGAGAPGRLVAGNEGCAYVPASVTSIATELAARKGVRILASAEAPRGERAGEPTGELAVTVGDTGGDARGQVDIALHGPMTEGATKPRTGGRDGNAVALTPGTVDATPRLPDPARTPSGGLLVIRGASWTWKPIVDAP